MLWYKHEVDTLQPADPGAQQTVTATDFLTEARRCLDVLLASCEALTAPGFDVDCVHDTLEISVQGRGKYVLHPHTFTQQLWLSSPLSGAHHYVWDPATRLWQSTQPGPDLIRCLEEELTDALGCLVVLRPEH